MPKRALDLALPLVGILVFSFFFFPSMRFVGLIPDDALVGRVAWGFLRRIPALIDDIDSVRVFGRAFPLDWSCYHGPGEFYSTVPFVWIFGPVAAAIQWRSALCAFAVIAATYRLGLLLYRDRWAAFFAAALLAASPGLTIMAFFGAKLGAAEVAAGTVALCLFLSYAERRRPAFAYWGCASLGFALSCRSTMIAFVFGLGAYAWLFRAEIRALLPARPGERARFIAAGAGIVLVFCAPLLAALLFRERWPELGAHVLVQESGVSNLDFGSNLLVRFRQLNRTLGSLPYYWAFRMDPFPFSSASDLLLDGALLAGAFMALRAAVLKKAAAKRWMLPCVVGAAYFMLSAFCPTELQPYQLFPILPLVYLTAASAVAMPRRRAIRVPLILAFLLFTAGRVYSSAERFRGFRSQVSRSRVFAVAEDLEDWLSRHPDERPVFFGWGKEHVRFLSGGRIIGRPGTTAASRPEFERQWDEMAVTERTLLVVNGDFPADLFQIIERVARRRRRVLELVDSIRRPSGEIAFGLYRLARAPD